MCYIYAWFVKMLFKDIEFEANNYNIVFKINVDYKWNNVY